MLYTEKSTSLLYEVRMFDDYVLVRPASPGFESHLEKMDFIEFSKEFEEFSGNQDQVYSYLDGDDPGLPTSSVRRKQ